MKRYWVEYADHWERSLPMTYWVHVETDGRPWLEALAFEPPAPRPIAGRGFAIFHVEVDGMVFRFSSLPEIEELLRIFRMKVMPTSRRMCAQRQARGSPAPVAGPNSHWLSRLPAPTKSLRYRRKAITMLARALEEFRRVH